MAETRASKTHSGNNVYTGLLALAALALVGTVALVCYFGYTYYDSIFKVSGS